MTDDVLVRAAERLTEAVESVDWTTRNAHLEVLNGDEIVWYSLSPDLARALGDWLRQTAERHTAIDYAPWAEYCDGCSDSSIEGDSGGNGPHLVGWPCRDFVAAERVANAILGSTE